MKIMTMKAGSNKKTTAMRGAGAICGRKLPAHHRAMGGRRASSHEGSGIHKTAKPPGACKKPPVLTLQSNAKLKHLDEECKRLLVLIEQSKAKLEHVDEERKRLLVLVTAPKKNAACSSKGAKMQSSARAVQVHVLQCLTCTGAFLINDA